jgi:hypothetical protein
MGEYITKAGEQSHESLGWQCAEKVFFDIPDTVTAIELGYRVSEYPAVLEGSFECDDPFLNTLWIKCRTTLTVGTRDGFMDGPERERTQWLGAAIHQLQQSFYSLSPVPANQMIRKGIDNAFGFVRNGSIPSIAPVSHERWCELPDQSLATVLIFWQYYEFTGEHDYFGQAYAISQEYLLKKYTMGSDGVVGERKGPGIWSWGDWGAGVDMLLLQNCWYYIALDLTLKMGSVLGIDPSTDASARELEARKKSISVHFDAVFWKAGGYYRSTGFGMTCDRSNAMAVFAGLVSPDKYPAILKVLETVKHATPYMEKWILEALFLMGYEDTALARMKERYAEMVASNCSMIWEQLIRADGEDSHAWSAGPLSLLSRALLESLRSKRASRSSRWRRSCRLSRRFTPWFRLCAERSR